MLGDLKIIAEFWQNYGATGLILIVVFVSLFINVRLFAKLFGNHLAHIHEDLKASNAKIDEVKKDVAEVKKEIKDANKETNSLGERVSKLEGKLE